MAHGLPKSKPRVTSFEQLHALLEIGAEIAVAKSPLDGRYAMTALYKEERYSFWDGTLGGVIHRAHIGLIQVKEEGAA